MITSAYVRTMAAYNAEMNNRLYDAAERLGEAERRRDRGAFWHSLHGTLVHILWGDAQWMSRFDGWERPATPIKQSDHMLEDWAELRAAREKADNDISHRAQGPRRRDQATPRRPRSLGAIPAWRGRRAAMAAVLRCAGGALLQQM